MARKILKTTYLDHFQTNKQTNKILKLELVDYFPKQLNRKEGLLA